MEESMTETIPEPQAPEPEAEPQAPETPAGEPQDLGDAGKKALAEERKARKAAEKAQADLAARLKEFEDRDKSELDKVAERATTAEQERDAARAEALRLRIAAEFGISSAPDEDSELSDADLFLTAADEETMRRQAQRYAARVGQPKTPPVPKPDPSQGARGPVGMDARIAEAEKNGDVRTSIALKSQALLKK
jgi:hypothetical protein